MGIYKHCASACDLSVITFVMYELFIFIVLKDDYINLNLT